MIRHVRVDYDSPNPPGVFVIRANAKGKIVGENPYLANRQQRHGASVTQKVVARSDQDDYKIGKPLD